MMYMRFAKYCRIRLSRFQDSPISGFSVCALCDFLLIKAGRPAIRMRFNWFLWKYINHIMIHEYLGITLGAPCLHYHTLHVYWLSKNARHIHDRHEARVHAKKWWFYDGLPGCLILWKQLVFPRNTSTSIQGERFSPILTWRFSLILSCAADCAADSSVHEVARCASCLTAPHKDRQTRGDWYHRSCCSFPFILWCSGCIYYKCSWSKPRANLKKKTSFAYKGRWFLLRTIKYLLKCRRYWGRPVNEVRTKKTEEPHSPWLLFQ